MTYQNKLEVLQDYNSLCNPFSQNELDKIIFQYYTCCESSLDIRDNDNSFMSWFPSTNLIIKGYLNNEIQ